MKRLFAIALALAMLTACGIKKPLMRPQEIPAYEEKMRRKQEKLNEGSAPAAPQPPTPEKQN